VLGNFIDTKVALDNSAMLIPIYQWTSKYLLRECVVCTL